MKMAFLFEGSGVTPEQYDQILEKLNLGGKAAPGGIFHVAGPMKGGGMRVVDVWESAEIADKFYKERLTPIMQELGLAQPKITPFPVHNILQP